VNLSARSWVFPAAAGGQALAENLGASDQNDIAVENGLCNAEEAGHDLRIVVGVHGGPIDEPLISGEDAGLVWSCETKKPIVLRSLLRTFRRPPAGRAHGVFVPFFGADDGGDGQHDRALSTMNFRKTDFDAATDRRCGIIEQPGGAHVSARRAMRNSD